MSGTGRAQPGDLPKLVSYKYLLEEYGWPKRSIQEWVKSRKFPMPADLPGREKVWFLQDIRELFENGRRRRCSDAISRPEDLTPDKLAEATVELLCRAIENELGEAIDPRGIRITYGPVPQPISEDELAKAETREAVMLRERFSGFSAAQSVIMAAWLFPELRQMFSAGEVEGCEDVLRDEERLFGLAAKALNPEVWESVLAEFKALSSEGSGSDQ